MEFPSVSPEEILTPLQRRALTRLFADYKELSAFFLTGGTALAAFYFGHRRSDDLDLFTTDASALLTIPAVMDDWAQREGLTVERVREFTFIQQYEVRDPQSADAPALRIDFVKDIATQFGERRNVGGIWVDDPRNIGSNKVCAILGRTDVKDFIDLYVLLRHGYDFDALFAEAQQKDSGLTPFYFAASLREVASFSRLPPMMWDIRLSEVQQFFVSLADRLLASLNPSD